MIACCQIPRDKQLKRDLLNAWAGHKLVLLYYFPTVHFINVDYKAEAQ